MHHVLIILLHRPFVADGHLYSTSRSVSVDCFMKCALAASNIALLLRAYHRAFSSRRAPYLISYATYVAATIHARIAAKQANDSSAHNNLAICLAVLKENQETNSAVNKASMIVQSLMKRLGVVIEDAFMQALEMDGFSKPQDSSTMQSNTTEQLRRSMLVTQESGSNAMSGALAPGAIHRTRLHLSQTGWTLMALSRVSFKSTMGMPSAVCAQCISRRTKPQVTLRAHLGSIRTSNTSITSSTSSLLKFPWGRNTPWGTMR